MKTMISVLFAAGLSVLAFAAIEASPARDSRNCVFRDTEPDFKPTEMKPVHSNDNTSLIYAFGYLHYEFADKEEKKVYLPVEPNSIEYNPNNTDYQVKLNSECSTIWLSLKKIENNWRRVDKIKVDLVQPNGSYTQCVIDSQIRFENGPGYHYKCPVRTVFNCFGSKDGQRDEGWHFVTFLTFRSIEFGLDENPMSVKEGRFSTLNVECFQPSMNS